MSSPPSSRSHTIAACLCVAAAVGLPSATYATIVLSFSSPPQGLATNWANGAGEGGKHLVWGVIVDRNCDGLATTYLPAGVNFVTAGANNTSGQSLLDGSGSLTDDLLFVSPAAMVTIPAAFVGVDGSVSGLNMLPSSGVMPYLQGINTGDPFYVVWFDTEMGSSGAAPSGVPQAGDAFGIFSHPDLLIPSDGSNQPYYFTFAGADPLRTMTHAWAPEPSSAGLGLLGAALLMRRQRRQHR